MKTTKELKCLIDIGYDNPDNYKDSKVDFDIIKIPIRTDIALSLNTGDIIAFNYGKEYFEVTLEYKWFDTTNEKFDKLLLSCSLK